MLTREKALERAREMEKRAAEDPWSLSEGGIAAELLAVQRETVEECCSAICARCREGSTPRNDVISANGMRFWHELKHSDGTPSGTFGPCSARYIRAALETSEKEGRG